MCLSAVKRRVFVGSAGLMLELEKGTFTKDDVVIMLRSDLVAIGELVRDGRAQQVEQLAEATRGGRSIVFTPEKARDASEVPWLVARHLRNNGIAVDAERLASVGLLTTHGEIRAELVQLLTATGTIDVIA